MRVPLRPLLAAGVLTAGLVVAGVVVLGGDDDTGSSEPTEAPFTTTALGDVDTTTITFPRGPFCDDLDPRQVTAALGGEPVDQTSWQNGDPVPTGSGQDVGHEFGCSYVGADGTTASAWVFAPPVDAARARALTARAGQGCTAAPTSFGVSGSVLTCADRVAYRGLLGDAWLTCEVTTTDANVAGRWCAGVLALTD